MASTQHKQWIELKEKDTYNETVDNKSLVVTVNWIIDYNVFDVRFARDSMKTQIRFIEEKIEMAR